MRSCPLDACPTAENASTGVTANRIYDSFMINDKVGVEVEEKVVQYLHLDMVAQ